MSPHQPPSPPTPPLPLAALPASGRFADLPLAEGLALGGWHLWVTQETIGLIVVCQPLRAIVRIWLSSNGWWEYRNKRTPPEQIYTVYSTENAALGGARFLGWLDDERRPRWALPAGLFEEGDWLFRADADALVISYPPDDLTITFTARPTAWSSSYANLPDV